MEIHPIYDCLTAVQDNAILYGKEVIYGHQKNDCEGTQGFA